MPPRTAAILLSMLALAGGALPPAPAAADAAGPEAGALLAWPALTRESRPWAYNWWMGSAVDPENLTRELTRYRDGGLGGVHVIPIYRAKGFEARAIEYLSPDWMEMLGHATAEAERLGLGLDMTTGTGWCFGGPTVGEPDAAMKPELTRHELAPGAAFALDIAPGQIVAAAAYGAEGAALDITDALRAGAGRPWQPQGGPWRVYVLSVKPTGQRVKRAAPGGEGFMMNPFYADGMRRYLDRFTAAFAAYAGAPPRAMYHDSYEYHGNAWAPDLLDEFARRRGYRLEEQLPLLFGEGDPEEIARIKHDYRETVSDMMVEGAFPVWVEWCHQRGILTRNQAHGAPANLLDFYAVVDIPETEMFRNDRDPLAAKFASAAAHVAGRRLVAAETGTWLAEHFTETLGDMKTLVDLLFSAGVNHVIYHGTCYSPDDAPWPGWLFYASTQMNPRNSIWRDAPALNAYIARCQSILQSGAPDNDILVYWPIHDFWRKPEGMIEQMSVHNRAWLDDWPVGEVARHLWRRGFAFDYISDRLLAQARVEGGRIVLPGASYGLIVVPPAKHVPDATARQLISLATAGGKVLCVDPPPALAAGPVMVDDLDAGLGRASIQREEVVDLPGCLFVRRSFEQGTHLFVANQGATAIDQWVALARPARAVVLMDPMTAATGVAATREGPDGRLQLYLQLEPGQAIIARMLAARTVDGPAWNYWRHAGDPVRIEGTWRVEFIEGGPDLPPAYETEALASWTEAGNDAAERFAGTARYSITFQAPPGPGPFLLDLGRVCQSARVRLNGSELGTLFAAPFRILLPDLRAGSNRLEVEVTSVAANRIRDLDRRGVPWKAFHDINFVNVDYKPFDASEWPVRDAGLLGPALLAPVTAVRP